MLKVGVGRGRGGGVVWEKVRSLHSSTRPSLRGTVSDELLLLLHIAKALNCDVASIPEQRLACHRGV